MLPENFPELKYLEKNLFQAARLESLNYYNGVMLRISLMGTICYCRRRIYKLDSTTAPESKRALADERDWN
jgi:hypothetical protein